MSEVALGRPLHGESLALLGAVEKIKIEQVLVRKAWYKVGRLRARRTVVWGRWGGVLVTEATARPLCASMLYQRAGRSNRAFTLIWGQVFPLIAAARGTSSGMAMKFRPWMDGRGGNFYWGF